MQHHLLCTDPKRDGETEPALNDSGAWRKGEIMNVGSIFSKLSIASQNRTRVQRNGTVDFQKRLRDAGTSDVKKDEYVQSSQKPVSTCDMYRGPNIVSSLVNQLPLETMNYKIEQADECYMKDFVITDKKSGQKLYLDENELVVQKDESSGIKFIFDTSDKVTMQPKLVVVEELEQALKTWINKAGKPMQEKQLEDYSVNTDQNTGIRYLTRNGQEGKGADILLLTDADRSKFEEIKNEYLKYPNIAENQDIAEIRAAMEISGNSKRCANGVLTVVDGYMSFTSYDGKKENSWSKILDSKAMYDRAYVMLQINDLQGIEDEEFWNKFFDEMESSDSQEQESGTDSNIIVKPDGSKVLVITMEINGMESTMSIKISEPTDFVSNGENEQSQSQSEEFTNDNIEGAK